MYFFRKLESKKKGLFPLTFIENAHNLKVNMDTDSDKNLILQVNNTNFENLPLRLYPINISAVDDRIIFEGKIILNGLEIIDG